MPGAVEGRGAEELREVVRLKYGEAAKRAAEGLGEKASCGCGCGEAGTDAITRDLYDAVTASSLPGKAVLASLGCGNPTALAELNAGEVVLDLGSGGGIDVLLSARRVGPTGRAYGLDMTDEMLDLATRNAAEAGVTNAVFLKGEIEAIPLPAASVDVIISNCVINLSADKGRVLAEAFRVLKPGGRFAVSDVLIRGEIPAALRRNMELWVGCVAGALEENEFLSLLAEAGFEDGSIEVTREYRPADAQVWLEEAGLDVDAMAAEVEGRVVSGFVRARKPAGAGASTRPPLASRPALVTLAAAPTGAEAAGATGAAGAPCCGPDCCG